MVASPAQTDSAEPAPASVDLGSFLAGSGGVVLLLLLSLAARLMTYNPVADGSYDSYVRAVAIAGVSAIIVAVLLAWQFTPAYVWAAAGLILTLLPGDAWHYARLWSAAQFAQEKVVFESTLAGAALDPARWDHELGSGATLSVADGSLRVETPAGSIGWLEPRFELELPTPRPWHPAALREQHPDYTSCLGDALSACWSILYPWRSPQPGWPPAAAAGSSGGLAPHAPNGRWRDCRHRDSRSGPQPLRVVPTHSEVRSEGHLAGNRRSRGVDRHTA